MSQSIRTPVNEWAHQAADNVSETAASVGETAHQAVSAIGAMASQAAHDAAAKANELAAVAGAGIQGLGDRLGKSAPQTGALGNASQTVAHTIKEGGKYIERSKFGGMSEDIARLIRRNPIPAVLIGVAVGWFACRKLKG